MLNLGWSVASFFAGSFCGFLAAILLLSILQQGRLEDEERIRAGAPAHGPLLEPMRR